MNNLDRKKELFLLTKKLKQSLPVIKPINSSNLENYFYQKQYAKVISEIKRHMGITCRLSVKYIPTETKNGEHPVFIRLPVNFPYLGSTAYEQMTISMVFYEDLLKSFHKFTMAISHEMSHIVLHSINHPLMTSEEATDITAIILGFGREYELGHTIFYESRTHEIICKTGYLTFEEVIYVISILES